jgi:deoxyribose-phosphate aldolase
MTLFSKYHYPFSVLGLNEKINEISLGSDKNYTGEVLKSIFGLIDLTSLNSTDSAGKIEKMCDKVNHFEQQYPSFPSVAAICVYPNFVSTVKENLAKKGVGIASVAAGFPSSQTFLDIKLAEVKQAVKNGATEIDVVISVGEFLSGNYQLVADEISAIKDAVGNAHLKVILETGALIDPLKIWEASILAMNAGADFIKTSTGKIQTSATIDAVVVMVEAILAFYKETGKRIGLKPAGGISTGHDAVVYYSAVEKILGKEWLNPGLFRIGASSLANNLISEVNRIETGIDASIKYF